MSVSLLAKMAVLLGVGIALLVPLSMVSGVVSERSARRAGVVQEVQQSSAGPQRVTGPVLVMQYRLREPYKDSVPETGPDGKTAWREVQKERFSDHTVVQLPAKLDINAQAKTAKLYRGLYDALTYTAAVDLKGTLAYDFSAVTVDPNVTVQRTWLAIGIGDVRGLSSAPQVQWGGAARTVEAGSWLPQVGEGVRVPLLDLDAKKPGAVPFAIHVDLRGMERLAFTPVGKETTVKVQADWGSPSFQGAMLPMERRVAADGFSATWKTSWFATNLDEAFRKAVEGQTQPTIHELATAFIDPTDVYAQADRTVKYAVLFVFLTFTAFFLFEVQRRLRIHPLQYGLVGAAQAAFYLLLIALAEHIDFAYAYLAGAAACALLIAFYLAHVLGHWVRGLGFGGMIGALYGALYLLVQSEDYALLLGSGLVFGALAAVMVATRKLDWYAVGRGEAVA